MKRINLLDVETSNKIAAGEVIERPSSVVKEILENSIDANSKNITIEIENGGENLIKIIDDGEGIHPNDIDKAFLPHATSKIKDIGDIFSINTMGFRGEALPSIASVSHTKLTSRIANCDLGREIVISGGNVEGIHDAGSNPGTILEVRDLFFNVPARKKFLKSVSRESSIISDIVGRIALSHEDIAITLYNNGKKIIRTFGTNDLKDTIRAIYGKNIMDNLIYFEGHIDEATVYGYIGNESISKGSRNYQSIFVNKRYIKNKVIGAAVEQAFKSFIPINKFPFFILYLEIYPELIDVNIHPNKSEIKFSDDRKLFKLVFDAVHGALRKYLESEFMIPEENKEKPQTDVYENISYLSKDICKDNSVVTHVSDFNKQENVRDNDNKEAILPNESSMKEYSLYSKDISKNEVNNDIEVPLDLKRNSKNILIEENHPHTYDKSEKMSSSMVKTPKLPPLRVIGQFNKTYIIAEFNTELYLIDQHAAHEKIIFEKYIMDIKNREIMSQPLLIPLLLDLNEDDFAIYKENVDIFLNTGFIVEEFGDNTVNIKECPYILGKADLKGFFLAILQDIKNLGSGSTTDIKYNKIAQMACKKAVKANEELGENEMYHLIDELRYSENPYTCPHGRPTIIKITLYEMEKRFKRIQ